MNKLQAVLNQAWFPPFLFLILLLVLSLNHFLFWDTVQFGALHPDFYFQSDWRTFWLPPALDSGHPPYFGQYIALWWACFGKSLPVTHLAMWPIVLGIFYQCWRLTKQLFPKQRTWILLALLLEPVLLGQITLVSPDLVLVFAFLLGINEINSTKKRFLVMAVIIMGMVSTRGMMLGLVLFLWYWLREGEWRLFWKTPIKIGIPNRGIGKIRWFIPGGIVAIIFLVAHYVEFGWIGYHEGSTWAPSFEKVGLAGLARNSIIIGIHLLDFGHLFILGLLGWTAFKNWSQIKTDKLLRQYVLLAGLLLLFLLPTLIIHKYLFNHRYLLPFFIIFDLLALLAIFKYWQRPKRGLVLSTILLVAGSFWIYPQPIATSWDDTILHWGYYPARDKMMEYLSIVNIPLDEIGTAFPNINAPAIIDLGGDTVSFVKKDLYRQDWIFYSNVMNDFTEEELKLLENDFEFVVGFKHWPVRVELYRRKGRSMIGSVRY